jgi:hypothetical protein
MKPKSRRKSLRTWSGAIADWMTECIGGPPTNLLKAEQEFKELQEAVALGKSNQKIAFEAADVIIVLTGFIAHLGFDASAMVGSKMTINKARTWQQMPDGTYQHVKSSGPAPIKGIN